ncbi:MAG: type II toxin-antitoxin system Phd/YefM family antitoxin [Actinomycetota bacterium]
MEKLLINADDFIGGRELRENLPSILKDVKEEYRTVVVTTNGKPAGVLLSVDAYVDLLETIDDLQNVELLAEIEQSRKDIAEGKYMTLEEYDKKRRAEEAARKKKKKRIA